MRDDDGDHRRDDVGVARREHAHPHSEQQDEQDADAQTVVEQIVGVGPVDGVFVATDRAHGDAQPDDERDRQREQRDQQRR